MSYNLFLDDERLPKNVIWIDLPLVPWEIARNYKQFCQLINSRGLPVNVSFDHDLADEHYKDLGQSGSIGYEKFTEKTGYDCVKFMIEYCMNHNKPVPNCFYHTMNQVGAGNMYTYIESYKRSLK